MQKLNVVGKLFPQILSGEKTSTIRWQEAHIKPGLMVYENEDNPTQSVIVWVISYNELPLRDVASFLGIEKEWPSNSMLESMRNYYPTIQLYSQVRVIVHLTPEETKAHQ